MKAKNLNFIFINLFFVVAVFFCIFTLLQGKLAQSFLVISIFTIVIFLFSFWHSLIKFGLRNAFFFLMIVLALSFSLEVIGVNLGYEFQGYYKYSEFLGAKILNVPVLVILMWVSVIYISYQVSEHITDFRFEKNTLFLQRFWISVWSAFLTALITAAWDIGLDPLAVNLGWRVWEKGGEYFGVPIGNFIDWIVISFVAVFIFKLFFEKESLEKETAADYAPLICYTLLCFSTIFLALSQGIPLFAFIVFVSMFPFISIMIVRLLVVQLKLPRQYKK